MIILYGCQCILIIMIMIVIITTIIMIIKCEYFHSGYMLFLIESLSWYLFS